MGSDGRGWKICFSFQERFWIRSKLIQGFLVAQQPYCNEVSLAGYFFMGTLNQNTGKRVPLGCQGLDGLFIDSVELCNTCGMYGMYGPRLTGSYPAPSPTSEI